jgi:hypothetical protein
MILRRLKDNYDAAKAELQGLGRSHARMIKNAHDIGGIIDPNRRVPRPTRQHVKMLDRKVMVFFTDGSLRNAMGPKPRDLSGRQRRIKLKLLRRAYRHAQKSA